MSTARLHIEIGLDAVEGIEDKCDLFQHVEDCLEHGPWHRVSTTHSHGMLQRRWSHALFVRSMLVDVLRLLLLPTLT